MTNKNSLYQSTLSTSPYRTGNVYYDKTLCGRIEETLDGYIFTYNQDYLARDDTHAISLTLPLTDKPFHSNILFPFFDGLIPEGWLLETASNALKIKKHDKMELLLCICEDTIGAISVRKEE